MHLDSGFSRRRARVEMIPLIDCMFILLVFFIYSMLAMTIQRGVAVNLPSGTRVDRITEDAIVISITSTNELFVNREPVRREELDAALRRLIGDNPSPRIVLNGDADARHGQIFAILDLLRNRGWTNLSILSTEASEP